MMTKVVEGMTPFEAAFGKKLDLKGVREWGEWGYVRIEGGTKLGGRVRKGRWLGMDDESKGARIYWPDSKMVTVERNISYNNVLVDCSEEKLETITIDKTTTNSPNAVTPNTNIMPLAIKPLAIDIKDSDIEPSKQI